MKMPEIKGFIDVSLVDWDGKVSSVIFLPTCNLRCPFCYNTKLVLNPEKMPTVPFEEIQSYLEKRKGWIDGVVITGGEPTIHSQLSNLCQKVKELGLPIKLDTNGTNPQVLQRLAEQHLIDYVAMDIKAPLTPRKYAKAVGVQAEKLIGKVKETVNFLLEGKLDYEFRTTVVPKLHEKVDIEQICLAIKDCRKFVIQNFKGDLETINPEFMHVKPFSQQALEDMFLTAKKIIPNTLLRE
jgi:pyruvate formate lyase activating enzyme